MPADSAFALEPLFQSKLRVLVLKENASNLFMIERVLKGLGCESIPLGNGERALEILERDNFDVVLLDLLLLGIGDLAVLAAIREKEWFSGMEPRRVVALTAMLM